MKKLILIFITIMFFGCAPLIEYEDDSGLETCLKGIVRIPLCVATLGISEQVILEEAKAHNKKLIQQMWDEYYSTSNEYQRQQLLREIEHVMELNLEINKGLQNWKEFAETIGNKVHVNINQGRPGSRMRCNCIALDDDYVECDCY